MDNFFTSIELKHLKEKNVFATSTIRTNKMEKVLLSDTKEMEKKPKGNSQSCTGLLTMTQWWFVGKTIKPLLLLQ